MMAMGNRLWVMGKDVSAYCLWPIAYSLECL